MLTRIDCYVYYIFIAMFVFIVVITMYVATHCIIVFCCYYAYIMRIIIVFRSIYSLLVIFSHGRWLQEKVAIKF